MRRENLALARHVKELHEQIARLEAIEKSVADEREQLAAERQELAKRRQQMKKEEQAAAGTTRRAERALTQYKKMLEEARTSLSLDVTSEAVEVWQAMAPTRGEVLYASQSWQILMLYFRLVQDNVSQPRR